LIDKCIKYQRFLKYILIHIHIDTVSVKNNNLKNLICNTKDNIKNNNNDLVFIVAVTVTVYKL